MKRPHSLARLAAGRFCAISFLALVCGSAWAQPDLVVSEISAPAQGLGGARVTVGFRVSNAGDTTAPEHLVGIYISSDPKIDQSDALIGYATVSSLAPGASTLAGAVVALPADMGVSYATTQYVGVYADVDGLVSETDRGNNTAVSGTSTVINGTACEPDGFESNSALSEARSLRLGDRQGHNLCDGTPDWFVLNGVGGREYRFSTAERYSESAYVQMSLHDAAGNTLASLQTTGMSPTLAWVAPATDTYYLRVAQAWNTRAYVISMADVSPDLTEMNIPSAPTAAVPGALLRFSDSVGNRGAADTGPFSVGYYLSRDPHITAADTFLDRRWVSGLAREAYSSTAWNQSLASIPLNVAPGNYYLGAVADDQDAVPEYRERNNVSAGLLIRIDPPLCDADAAENDDWVMHSVVVPLDTPLQRNHCDDIADWLAFDAVAGEGYVIETSGIGRRQAVLLELYGQDGRSLLATGDPGTSGSRSDHTARIVWQAPATGRYFVKASSTMATPAIGAGTEYTITVFRQAALPDLKARTTNDISGGYKGILGGFASLPLTLHNYGFAAAGASHVGMYLSTDWNVTTSDLLLVTVPMSALNAGDSADYYPNPTFSFPTNLAPGTYYIGAIADLAGAVTELSEVNNVSRPLAFQLSAPVCAPDSYEQDDFSDQAKPIAVGQPQAHNHCDDGRDYLYVNIPESGIYLFELTNAPVNTTTMSVWNPAGEIVASYDTRRELTLSAGRHLIEARGYVGANSDYTISVSLLKRLRGRK